MAGVAGGYRVLPTIRGARNLGQLDTLIESDHEHGRVDVKILPATASHIQDKGVRGNVFQVFLDMLPLS